MSVTEWLQSVLPRGAACAGGGLLSLSDAPLFPVEETSVAHAVPKRRTEFRTGRAYARAALAALGCAPAPIPVGESRQPLWPNGFLGSISHSGPWVGCAAVRCGRVGFDVEMGSGERIATFVAREAALKACGAGIGALREVHLSAGRASCRGELLYAHALQLFPGAAACVMTSLAGPGLAAHALSLEELFAP